MTVKETKSDIELEDGVTGFWKQRRIEQDERKMKKLPRRVSIIYDLQKFGFKIKKMNEFQFRITRDGSDFVFDIFPVSMEYHNVSLDIKGEVRGEVRMIPFVRSCFSNYKKRKEIHVKKKLQ